MNDLFLITSRPKVLLHFLEGSTKALGRAESAETQHRVIALFHAAVILLDPSIQIGAPAMLDFRTKDLADGARIRIVAITRYWARNLPHTPSIDIWSIHRNGAA